MEDVFIALGLLGVAINLIAYGLLTAGKLRADALSYQVINVCGTTGILLSLIAQWNLPVFISNIAWLLIALVGVARILLNQKRSA
jgi:hypothetical protein